MIERLIPRYPTFLIIGLAIVATSLFLMTAGRDVLIGVSPNPPKDTDRRREDSGRGWVRELQGRWPGVLG